MAFMFDRSVGKIFIFSPQSVCSRISFSSFLAMAHISSMFSSLRSSFTNSLPNPPLAPVTIAIFFPLRSSVLH